MSHRTCSRPDCDRPHLARDLCRKHYYQANPEKPRERRTQHECSRCGSSYLTRNDPRRTFGTCPPCSATVRGPKAGAAHSESARVLRDLKPPPEPKVKTCQHCGESFIGTRRAYCSATCARESAMTAQGCRDRKCRDCGADLGRLSLLILCESCRVVSFKAARHATKQQRRAVKHGVDADRFDPVEVFDRDGWRCGICQRPIDRRLSYPHPMSVSLDHVVPISWGGRHTRANTTSAHLRCNVAKGNRIEYAQPLLVG